MLPGTYLTDDRRLFRVVSHFTTTLRPFAELEDCLMLEVIRYSPDGLYGMGLRPVRARADRAANELDDVNLGFRGS